MKKIFADTNVFIDLIAHRKLFNKFAIKLFSKAKNKTLKLCTSSHAFATTPYTLKNHLSDVKLHQILYYLTEFISIIEINNNTIKKALKSKYKNFEDAIQIITAYTVDKMACIVTRNIKDFELPVYTPDELIKKFNKK